MNFEWINKQGVKTEDDIVIQFTGRFTAEYRDGTKILKLDIDDGVMGNKTCINFKRSDFTKWDNSGGSLTPTEQERAINIFKEALVFQGLVPLVE